MKVNRTIDGKQFECWTTANKSSKRLPSAQTWTATQRLLGLSPAARFYAVPMGWPVIYRDFGSIRILPHNAPATGLHMSQVAPGVFEHPTYLTCFLNVCKCDGEVERIAPPDTASVDITVRWT